MNEQMLKLYKLAHLPHIARDPSNNMPYETTLFSPDRFAELIVQECMEQVHYTRTDMINDNISQVIKERMAKHFGVEE